VRESLERTSERLRDGWIPEGNIGHGGRKKEEKIVSGRDQWCLESYLSLPPAGGVTLIKDESYVLLLAAK